MWYFCNSVNGNLRLIFIENTEKGLILKQVQCVNADKENPEKTLAAIALSNPTIELRAEVQQQKTLNQDGFNEPKAICRFSYSLDGNQFIPFGESFTAREGVWIGAKIGLFCSRPKPLNDSGYIDVDWFRITK